jgi:hypothetical protein
MNAATTRALWRSEGPPQYLALEIYIIYFVFIFVDCRGSRSLDKVGEESLYKSINKIDNR